MTLRLCAQVERDRVEHILSYLLSKTDGANYALHPNSSMLLREFSLSWAPRLDENTVIAAIHRMYRDSCLELEKFQLYYQSAAVKNKSTTKQAWDLFIPFAVDVRGLKSPRLVLLGTEFSLVKLSTLQKREIDQMGPKPFWPFLRVV